MLPDSDQDNALVFDPVDDDGQKEKAWFLSLGAYVCDGLEAAGIPACRHGLMARNAEWCLTRTEWEARYTRWVAEPEPDRIVNLNALIDIRAVAGHTELVLGLRTYFKRAVAATPAFLLHLANGARNLRIPNLAASSGTPSHESGTIAARSAAMTASKAAAKEAAGLFPAFARVYATRAGLSETATHDRLNALAAKGDLWEDTARDSAEAYEALLSARLQLYMIPSTNRGRIAEAVLKATLSQAAVLQKRIGFDFLGQQS
jgi:CBS domain-containing protein